MRLAIKYGHIDIIDYLVETRQLNSDMNKLLGELADINLIKELHKRGYFNEINTCKYQSKEITIAIYLN